MMPSCEHRVGKNGFTSIRAWSQGGGDSGELRWSSTWSARGVRVLEQHYGWAAGTLREGTFSMFQQQQAARAGEEVASVASGVFAEHRQM